MLEKVISFCLKQRGLIPFILILLAGLGLYSFLTIPIDAFPDVTNVQVEIVSTAPTLSPLEIERFVTNPIEISMRGLPGLVQMRSITKFGISVVTLVFRDNLDIYFARELVFERLAVARENIPEGVEIEMGPVASAMGEIYQYTLEGQQPELAQAKIQYLTELRLIQDWVVSPLLKSVPGVNEVNSFGGYLKQFQVVVDPDVLFKHGLTVNDIQEAIQKNNENVGGNVIDRHSEQFIVRGIGMLRSVEDIQNIILKSSKGIPLFVKDVAEVREGQAVRQGASVKDGKEESAGGIVMMLRGENSREVVKAVVQKVQEINSGNVLPGGIKIKPFYNRSAVVEKSTDTVVKAILGGAILIILILFIFLRGFRGALIVILALPLSAFLTFIVMKNIRLNANLMSLGGLAISIGMIIDATIIQVENVQRHLTDSKNSERKFSSVLKSVLEVRKPSIFGELIIAFTFLPILSLQGIEGKMFIPLAYTVAIALFSSLVLSILAIPALCLLILKPGREKESFVLRLAKKIYSPVLHWSLRNRIAVLAIAFILIAATLFVLPRLGTEFIPILDEGAFDMDIQLLPGISLPKALEISQLVEKKLMQFPELETIVSRTGQTGIALEARGVDKTGYVGALKPRSEWKNAKSREELFNKMRESLSPIPGMVFTFSQPIQCRIDELVAGTRAQIIVKLYGEEMDTLNQKAQKIAEVLARVRGATDLIVERVAGQPYISVTIDRNKIARHGVNVRDVLDVIEIAVGGKAATKIYQENRSFDLVVRFREERRNSAQAIGNILIRTNQGYSIPLSQLAEISTAEGPVQISRENGQRRIGVELNIKGRDIGSFVAEAKKRIRENVSLPGGYYLTWGGQFENQQRAMKKLTVIVPIVILLIFFFLTTTFGSLKLASLVILNLPFALVGGVFSLYASGLYLSVPASIGFIALFGIAVLNGIVLVAYISQLRKEEESLQGAIVKGCEIRLRPVLMTATITIFSLIPLIFATGPGSEVQKPLAVVVVGGLITSTLLTLVVLPVLYSLFEKKKE